MAPATWVVNHGALLPAHGTALDLACGRGRHSIWLAERGLTVHAIDRDPAAIAAVVENVAQRQLPVTAEVRDLERGNPALPASTYDVIVVTHYLHRALFPALIDALRPGGLLIYETFTQAQALRGKPTNPDFLLKPGELRELVRELEVLDYREGTFEEREVASVVARRKMQTT